ncbi:MAG: rhamnulokinase [Paramuribaculum sp.]|nr:rhamnulokinase [Paramuribaculum sp.]
MNRTYLAADFGGGSGRVIAGTILHDGSLQLSEIHRFTNRLVTLGDTTYWDFPALYADMLEGIGKAVKQGLHISGIAVDTWGVDFGFIDRCGHLLSLPVSYRDASVAGSTDRYFGNADRGEHYREAGIQIMDINSLYRLCDIKRNSPHLLEAADRLLFMPDLFSYFLTGSPNNEYTIASTSELIDPVNRTWNESLIASAELPRRLFGDIVYPGSIRGHLTDAVRKTVGIDYEVPVIAVGSHDTASAVYAVSSTFCADGTAFLSSGTWSLLGVALDAPVLTDDARMGGFTNEGGVDYTTRFLQNITGLWILQNLMAQWRSRNLPVDYATMIDGARASSFNAIIDVDDPCFHSPDSMEDAICTYLSKKSLPVPQSQADMVRCVLLSLADRYRRGIESLNRLLPTPVRRLEIIGGGSKNTLLNELTAQATGLPVTAGHAEATAIGNILLQARTTGAINSPTDIHSIDFT